jgi:hypothetical protein
MTDVAISDLLASFGLAGADAERARAVLEAEGITNPRKTRLSLVKIEPARAAIDARFARLCHACEARVAVDGRMRVRVRPEACANCGGSRNARALEELCAACRKGRIRRLVVVGGSSDIRRGLAAIDGQPQLRLVDGTERRTRSQADGDLAWADLVVVCGASELAHKVSRLYTTAKTSTPVVTSSRRGLEAIVGAVVDHVERRRHRRALPA